MGKTVSDLWARRRDWIAPEWGIAVAVACTTVVAAATALPNSPLQFYDALATPLIVLGLWWLIRERYWLSGKGVRIGLACWSIQPINKQIELAEEQFNRFSKSTDGLNKIRIKKVPQSISRDDARRRRFLAKYEFDHVIDLVIERHSRQDQAIDYRYRIQASASSSQDFNGSLKEQLQVYEHGLHLERANEIPHQTLEVNRIEVATNELLDVLLIYLAAFQYLNENAAVCVAIIDFLDGRLAAEGMDETSAARYAARFMVVRAAIAGTRFAIQEIPEPTILDEKRMWIVDLVNRYGEQFPILQILATRIQFLCGNLDESVDLAERAYRDSPTGKEKQHAAINYAVLSLFIGNWSKAAILFREAFIRQQYDQENFEELISFANFCCARDYQGASYLELLYRRLSGADVPDGLDSLVERWLDDDRSRRTLKLTLRDAASAHRRGTTASSSKPQREVEAKRRAKANRDRKRREKTSRRKRK